MKIFLFVLSIATWLGSSHCKDRRAKGEWDACGCIASDWSNLCAG